MITPQPLKEAPAAPRIILGVDPGLRHTGYGVIAYQRSHIKLIAQGVIHSEEGSLPERLGRIFAGLLKVAQTHRPDSAAIEMVFVNVNPKSTLALGQARGAAIAALTYAGLTVSEYTALQIKQGVVGYGWATKEQLKTMVLTLLGVEKQFSHTKDMAFDAADALACAITCALHGHTQKLLTLSQSKPTAPKVVGTILANDQELTAQEALILGLARGRKKNSRWPALPKK